MEYTLDVFSSEDDYARIQQAIVTYLDTYGTCRAELYEPETVTDKDGMIIKGEYGTLDLLFAPITDVRLTKTGSLGEGRQLLRWNVVIYSTSITD